MEIMLVTNNPLVRERFDGQYPVRFVQGGVAEVFTAARDLVHRGHRLYSHPLSGNLRPWETPCKTVMVGAAAGEASRDDILCIEYAVRYCGIRQVRVGQPAEAARRDYERIDLSLVESVLSL